MIRIFLAIISLLAAFFLAPAASAESPALLVATRVNGVAEIAWVGVPEISQVVALTDSPVGSAVVPPLMPQPVTAPPRAFRSVGVTLIGCPWVPLVPVAPA